MYCNNCGNQINPGTKFCPFCGAEQQQNPQQINQQPQQYSNQVNDKASFSPQTSVPQYVFYEANNGTYPGTRPPASVSFGEAIRLFFKRYVDFSGRSTRSEYWYPVLLNVLIGVGISVLSALLGPDNPVFGLISLVYSLYALAVLIPGIACTMRRLHDINRSGWYILLTFIPLVGAIILLYFECQPSAGDNQYGPAPEGVTNTY